MELSAPAEKKTTAPLLAGLLSCILHAALAAGLLYVLPYADNDKGEGLLSLSLVSLSVPGKAGNEGGCAVSEPREARTESPAKLEAAKPVEQKKPVSRMPKKSPARTEVKKAQKRTELPAKAAETASVASSGSAASSASPVQAGVSSSGVSDVPFGKPCGPAFTRFSRPVYPLQARRAGISGLVKLRVSLDDAGSVRDIEVLESGHHLLADAACAAIRRSAFRPYTENGKSLPSRTVIPIRFTLEQAL